MLDLLLFIACIWLVMSEKINTDNIIKLIGIGFIAVGALIELGGKQSNLIEFGVLFYFMANLITAYLGKKNRRYYDKVQHDS